MLISIVHISSPKKLQLRLISASNIYGITRRRDEDCPNFMARSECQVVQTERRSVID